MLTRNELLPNKIFCLNYTSDLYTIKHMSREIVIYEDNHGKEHSSSIEWCLHHWMPYNPPIEALAWLCPKCKDFYRKHQDYALKKCKNCDIPMLQVTMKEIR